MRPYRKLGRRSFLRRVVGSAIATGSLVAFGSEARAQVTDSDPTDPPGRGRGRPSVSDSDSGSSADPPGRGRGSAVATGDSDPSDRAGHARYPDRRRQADISGTWVGSNGVTYQFSQTEDRFTWELATVERGLGRVSSNTAEARWWGPNGDGAARAEFQADYDGTVREIRWNNGVVLRRP